MILNNDISQLIYTILIKQLKLIIVSWNTDTNKYKYRKRFLREQLLNPDSEEISKRYEYTQSLIDDNNYKTVEGLMGIIVDIERLRAFIGIIQPSEMYCLNYSYESVKIIDERGNIIVRNYYLQVKISSVL